MMLNRVLFGIAILTFASSGAPAHPLGSVGIEKPIGDTYRAGQCVVRHDRVAAIRLLDALPIEAEPHLQDAAQIVADSGCLEAALPENFPLFLRGAVAQELLLRDFPDFGGKPHSVARLVDLGLPAESDGELIIDDNGRRYQWSDCVVRNDTENVERLLSARIGSEQERKILMRMRPYMSACMGPQARFSASAPEIRSLFMQSAYQMFYRHWNGSLSAVGYAGAGNPLNKMVCRTYSDAGSRITKQRICMSQRDWSRADHMTREAISSYIERSVSRPPQ